MLLIKQLNRTIFTFLGVLIFSTFLHACSNGSAATQSINTAPVAFENANLTGAGATFPSPLYIKWFDVYFQETGTKINYQAVGSGVGIQQITSRTVDFGASDAIMTETQKQSAESEYGTILHIPMTSGAIAIIYNLEGIESGRVKVTGEVLANIYLKKVLYWNDPAIVALNPELELPDSPIAVVHRSDGSGTTFIFTDYLCKINQEWNSSIGSATSVSWLGDIGGLGNAGVAGQVQQIPGSIGYVELSYAKQNNLPWMLLENAAGNFQPPSLEGVTTAMEGIELPDDMEVMITNSANPEAYPICGFTWILAYVNQTDKSKGESLAKMLWWAIHDGQQYGITLDYAPLSTTAVAKAEQQIRSMNYKGQPFISQ
jgi:phosphate transport system substrate-binding protein